MRVPKLIDLIEQEESLYVAPLALKLGSKDLLFIRHRNVMKDMVSKVFGLDSSNPYGEYMGGE